MAVYAARDPALKETPHVIKRPAKVHIELRLVHVMDNAYDGSVGRDPTRGEERDAVLEVNDRVVLVPVPS
jgi:hypothetical protein